jgi:hypothetical protein
MWIFHTFLMYGGVVFLMYRGSMDMDSAGGTMDMDSGGGAMGSFGGATT